MDLIKEENTNTTYYRKGVDNVVTAKDSIVDLADMTIRGLQSLKINSDEDDELNSPITDDVDATYLAKGIRLENCDSGEDYELYFPEKTGTIALLDDITGGTSLETVSVTGSGNALTSATLSTDKKTLTLSKGETFLPTSGGTVDYINVSGLIKQGNPSSDSTITNMNRYAADLFVSGNGSAPNNPKVAGFYLGKSTSDENRHMDIVSGADYSYIDFNKASNVVDYQARCLVNVTTGNIS